MGESAETPLAVVHAARPRGRALLPLAPLVVVVFVVSGGAATLVGVLLSLAVTAALRPWVWALSGTVTAVVAGVLLDRGTTAAARRFPQLTEWFRPGE
ncbi:hypothetical protein A6P39_029765 [Streptomyces sp. FXJ1.172]|uniref:hypothetical protein n=1 Tax=Streptomyces sp. FXJ1.172 TaxID=710705 RepID=UPI0013313596|nr:hypothetical protein [Streptomyces sp. FXJ1.172]WEO97869.1 hypothetical protein A6P39_029765 [Streptomyces sp. FXJ1.172]